MNDVDAVHEGVRQRYADAALAVLNLEASGGCGAEGGCCGSERSCCGPVSHYDSELLTGLPEAVVAGSLGCGNPAALAELLPGETVLDLGSGGGIDVFLAARRVGPTGKVFGLDMTGEMLALARRNQAAAGIVNAEFIHGTIEQIPLPDESIDVILSNCVVNLSPDKVRVYAEAFRVLKPGGRVSIADIVQVGENVPADLRANPGLWAGCASGVISIEAHQRLLTEAGFRDAVVEVIAGTEAVIAPEYPGVRIASAMIRATKPAG